MRDAIVIALLRGLILCDFRKRSPDALLYQWFMRKSVVAVRLLCLGKQQLNCCWFSKKKENTGKTNYVPRADKIGGNNKGQCLDFHNNSIYIDIFYFKQNVNDRLLNYDKETITAIIVISLV